MRLSPIDKMLEQMSDMWIHGVLQRSELVRQLYTHGGELLSDVVNVCVPGPFLNITMQRLEKNPTDVYILSIHPHILYILNVGGYIFVMAFKKSVLVEIRSVRQP